MKSFSIFTYLAIACACFLSQVQAANPVTPLFTASIPWQNTGDNYPNNNGTFIFGTPNNNVGNGYNAATGTFTAPIAGYYHFSYMIVADIDATHSVNDIGFAINGSFVSEKVSAVTSFVSWNNRQLGSSTNDAIFYLNIGDTVSLMRVCCNNTKPYDWRGNFTGYGISSVGPQGPAGPQGPQGATGPQGPAGAPSSQPTTYTVACASGSDRGNGSCSCNGGKVFQSSTATGNSSCTAAAPTNVSCSANGYYSYGSDNILTTGCCLVCSSQ